MRALVVLAGPAALVDAAAAGVVLSLVVEDLLLLSQHTHVPQNVSDGPTCARSGRGAGDLHALAAAPGVGLGGCSCTSTPTSCTTCIPFVPGYHLRRIPYRPSHEVGWWTWVRASKRLAGVVLLFREPARHRASS